MLTNRQLSFGDRQVMLSMLSKAFGTDFEYFYQAQPTLSLAGWQSICELTNLTSLNCTLVSISISKLDGLNKLVHLTSLMLTLHEDCGEVERDPVWLSTLPLTLEFFALRCHLSMWSTDPQRVSTVYRSYAQCLPYISRLEKLDYLDLTLGGMINAAALKDFHPPSLRTLALRFASNVAMCGIEESKSVAQAFSPCKSLKSLVIWLPKNTPDLSNEFLSLVNQSLSPCANVRSFAFRS